MRPSGTMRPIHRWWRDGRPGKSSSCASGSPPSTDRPLECRRPRSRRGCERGWRAVRTRADVSALTTTAGRHRETCGPEWLGAFRIREGRTGRRRAVKIAAGGLSVRRCRCCNDTDRRSPVEGRRTGGAVVIASGGRSTAGGPRWSGDDALEPDRSRIEPMKLQLIARPMRREPAAITSKVGLRENPWPVHLETAGRRRSLRMTVATHVVRLSSRWPPRR